MPCAFAMAAVHTKDQREFIVRRLAAFDTPRDIAAAFAIRFKDTACAESDVLATDPRIVIVDPDLHTLFYTERARVLADPTQAPFTEQRARLIVLSKDAERYGNNNQPADRRSVFRQIAEELGIIGGRAGGAKGMPSGDVPAEIVEIVRTVVDPAKPAESA